MKARVFVCLKETVLDPQGETIARALISRGYGEIAGVRQGKVFDIEIGNGADRATVEKRIEEIARDVLSNPVIEEYRFEILD